MKILNELPPIYDRILKVFPGASTPGVIFAWGDTIYQPHNTDYIPAALIAHEEVHGKRQPDPVAWWEQYLTDQEFRYREEVHAHAAEFKSQNSHPMYKDRNRSSQLLQRTACRLIAELYNYQPKRSLSRAMTDVEAAVRGQFT